MTHHIVLHPRRNVYFIFLPLQVMRRALGENYGAIHKSKPLMARLSPRLFKRDLGFFYVISILYFGFTLRFLDTRRIERDGSTIENEWEKSSEKNCKTFLTPARCYTAIRRDLRFSSACFCSPRISSTQEAMRLHESIRRIADAMCTWAS